MAILKGPGEPKSYDGMYPAPHLHELSSIVEEHATQKQMPSITL